MQEGLGIISSSSIHNRTVCVWKIPILNFNNITHEQAQEILDVLRTEHNKQSTYDKIKQILNTKEQASK